MNTQQLLNEILAMLQTVKDDRQKLEKIHGFFISEIYQPEDETIEIPVKYKKVVAKIAENIDAGLICFLNPKTFEVEDIPKTMYYDPDDFEAITGETFESLNLNHQNWDNYITIEPVESHESYHIMEQFAQQVPDEKLQNQLFNALDKKRPFANFKNIIDFSEFRQNWFDFKQKQLELYVWDILQVELGI